MNRLIEGNDIWFMKTISKELIRQLQATEIEYIQKEIELLELKTFRRITTLGILALLLIAVWFC